MKSHIKLTLFLIFVSAIQAFAGGPAPIIDTNSVSGLGTISTQDADNVSITGGVASLTTLNGVAPALNMRTDGSNASTTITFPNSKIAGIASATIGSTVATSSTRLLNYGFTQLGELGTAIKTATIGGTTNVAEGGIVEVAHEIKGTIVGYTVLVTVGASQIAPGMTSEYNSGPGLAFNTYCTGTVIGVCNHATQSESIVSSPFTAMIFYKE